MKKLVYALLSCLLLSPSSAMAFIAWESSPGDKSIEFLGLLFGTVGSVLIPPEGASQIFGTMFNIFNMALLGMGSIAMVYIIWISAIETAHEGELMGRRWSAAWIPLRAMIGIGLLIPTSTGYSYSQIIIMWIVMHGIHAANAVWTVVLENYEVGAVYNLPTDEGLEDVSGASEAAQAMFESLICMEMVKQLYPDAEEGLGGSVEIYEDTGAIVVGVEGNEHHAEVCGGLQPSPKVSDYDEDVWRTQQTVAADNVAGFLAVYASEAVANDAVSGSDVIMGARKVISGIVASTSKIDGPVSLDSTKENSKADGWIYAGSYYSSFASWRTEYNAGNLTAPQPIKPDYAELPFSESDLKAMYTNYLEESDLLSEDEKPPTELDFSRTEGMSGELAMVWDEAGLTDFFIDIAMSFIDALNDKDTDPLISMQKLGSDLMVSVETIFFVLLIALVFVALIGCILESILPICWAFSTALSILMPLIMIFILLFWTAGATLGLYVPLIPFIVFTFTAVSWFLMVIEAMVAAPVAAIGLTNPSAENFGNIGPVMTLTLSIFLRPMLMVVGFVAAERLLKVLMYMINFGFEATVVSSLTGVGLFGAVVLVVLYVGIAIITVQECFSLIHILPDRVIRWIGGQIEQSNVSQNVEKAHSALNKGVDAGASMMKGGMAAAGALSEVQTSNESSDNKDDDQGDKDDGDPPDQGNNDSNVSADRDPSGSPGGGADPTKTPPPGGPAADSGTMAASGSTTAASGATAGGDVAKVAALAV